MRDLITFAGNMIKPSGVTSPAALLTNGRILFAGGEDGETGVGFSAAEVYDPSTGTSTATGNLTTPRFDHTETLLPDGTVLIAGSQRTGAFGGAGECPGRVSVDGSELPLEESVARVHSQLRATPLPAG
jgi:hypothetical protein